MSFFREADKDLDPILRFLEPNPNLPSTLLEVSERIATLAAFIVETVPRSDERTAGLRKLLEAKDCFVRAKL